VNEYRALNGLGCAYLGLTSAPRKEGLVREAIACFDQAIKVSPKFAPAYNNRGRAYHLKKELDRAIARPDLRPPRVLVAASGWLACDSPSAGGCLRTDGRSGDCAA
jgi:hypothetical protein